MLRKIIIADASCLIALNNIDELHLLQRLYQEISITKEVEEEYGEVLPNWIKIEEVKDKNTVSLLELELDKGESSAIALALETNNSLLIIDEKKGRNIAITMGLSISGTLGIIIKAKETKIIDKIKPLIEKLESVDFRISEKLKKQIFIQMNEE